MRSALAFAVAVALGAMAIGAYVAINACSDCGENRFWRAPMIDVTQEDADDRGARLRISPNMELRTDEVGVEFEDTPLPRADGAPRPGEWAVERDGEWLPGAAVLATNDVIVIGSQTPLEGARVRLLVLPCNCYVNPYEGTILA